MKRRIFAMVSALIVCASAAQLPYSSYCTQSITAYAEDYTTIYGEVLTYNTFSDHIEISGYNGNSTVTDVEIPSEIDGLPVTKITDMAFYGDSDITSITISDSVTEIGHGAFTGCNGLTSVTIPDSVTVLGYSAFSDCKNLTSVTLSDNITNLELTFNNCSSLTSVNFPAALKTIGQKTFVNTALTEIVIPDGVTEIGGHAFESCESLTSVTIAGSVEKIDGWAFDGCSNLSELTLSEGIKTIEMAAFQSCAALKEVVIPESVETVVMSAFGDMALESVTILNPEMFFGSGSFDMAENGIIYGYRNSTAKEYAERYEYTIEYLDSVLLGDVDFDGVVNSSDASLVLAAYAVVATGGDTPLSDDQIDAGDVNFDSAVDSSDASSILAYYAFTATGGQGTLEEFLG